MSDLQKEIRLSRFYDCHLSYLDKFNKAKADLLRSTDSLISHPDITNAHKQYLLRFRRSIA